MYVATQPAKAMGPRAILGATGRPGMSNWQPVRRSCVRNLGYSRARRRRAFSGLGQLSGGALTAQQQADLLATITTQVTAAPDVMPALTLYGYPTPTAFWNLPWTSTKIFADGQPLSASAQAAIANLGPDQTMANASECYSASNPPAGASGVQIVKAAAGAGATGTTLAVSMGLLATGVGAIVGLGVALVGLFAAIFKTRQQLAQAEQTVFCPAAAAAIDGWYAIQSAVNDGTVDVQTGVTGMKQLLADYRASPANSGTARMTSTECTSYCILAVSLYAATLAQALAWANESSSAAGAAGVPVAAATNAVTGAVATVSGDTGIPTAALYLLGLFVIYQLV